MVDGVLIKKGILINNGVIGGLMEYNMKMIVKLVMKI
jgi:hypothetical protein